MKQTCSKRYWVVLTSILAGLAAEGVASDAFAQQASAVDIAQARELLNQGLDLRKRGDDAGALEKLKGAHAVGHTPITGLELGRTQMALGHLVDARETFLSIARIPVRSEETARSTAARAQGADLAEQLRARIPTLVVRITGVPAGTVSVTIDGALVPAEALAAPRLLDPGSHDVAARSTTGGTAETKVDLKEADAREVELKLALSGGTEATAAAGASSPGPVGSRERAEPAGPTPSLWSSTPPPKAGPNVLAWTLLGSGLAVAAGGAVLLAVEAGNAATANTNHDRGGYSSATTGWTVGLVGAIVGGAAAASGGILLVVGQPKKGDGPQAALALGAGDVNLVGMW